jgi:hypothetical protein
MLTATATNRDDTPGLRDGDPIRYVPRGWVVAGYSPDNGQALVATECCTAFDCQGWDGDTPVAPKLVRNARGFRVCPKCGGSYG